MLADATRASGFINNIIHTTLAPCYFCSIQPSVRLKYFCIDFSAESTLHLLVLFSFSFLMAKSLELLIYNRHLSANLLPMDSRSRWCLMFDY